jgi:hypothetical protein
LKSDSTWFNFLNNPEILGFQKIIMDGEAKIYLKEEQVGE